MVAVLRPGEGVVASGVAGERRADGGEPLETADAFRVGSITKSMVATLAAVLVERGVVSFDTKLSAVFPGLAESFHPGFRDAELRHLLSHSAGLPGQELSMAHDGPVDQLLEELDGDAVAQRLELLGTLLTWEPSAAVGTPGPYSNVGYAVAAALLERVTGRPFEELIEHELFEPLGMERTFIGPWNGNGTLAVGHRLGSRTPIPPDDREWYPGGPTMHAAGLNVFTTLDDLTRFVGLHLDGLFGRDGLITAQSVRELHTVVVPDGRRGMGWMIHSDSPVLYHGHTGSDGTYFTAVTLYPEAEMATVVVTNTGLMPDRLGPLLVELYRTYGKPAELDEEEQR